MSNSIFSYQAPQDKPSPLLISVPHAGTEVPQAIRSRFTPEATQLGDTDWLVEQLYPFATELGIPILKANYSRYVIDLNRPLQQQKLYDDGRQETTLIPTHDFDGHALYQDGCDPSPEDTEERIVKYYHPYHDKLRSEIEMMRSRFAKILILEAHSIRRHVPRLYPKPLPDLILGNQRDKTCPPQIINAAHEALIQSGYDVRKNDPFMGGHITRHYAKPEEGIFTLQLEKSQDTYLDLNLGLHSEKGPQLQNTLRSMLESLLRSLEEYH